MMKKFFLILAALMIAAPAMATVTVKIDGDDSDPCKVWVTYEVTGADIAEGVRAFAVKITCDVNIIDINDYKLTGESTNEEPGYGIYIGSIQIDGDGDVTDYADPVAAYDDPDDPCQLGSNSIIIELGSLYDKNANPSDAPLSFGTLCSLTLENGDPGVTVTPAEDSLRGGIVMENPDIDPTDVNMVAYTFVEVGCQCFGDVSGLTLGVPDGAVDILDLVYITGYLNPAYAGSSYIAPVAEGYECADVSGLTLNQQDNAIDILDLVAITGYLNPAYAGSSYIGPCMPAPAPAE